MLFDLHTHSINSACSLNSLSMMEKYVKWLNRKRDVTIAITDHNRLTKTRFAISGEEVKTNQGEIIGLFIQDEIKPWKDAEEVIDNIHEQGGLAVIAHPFDTLRKDAMRSFSEPLKKADLVEVANGRSLNPFREKAKLLLKDNSFLPSAGSDAHFLWEIGDSGLVLDIDHDNIEPRAVKRAIARSWKIKRWDMIKENNALLCLPNMLLSGISSKTRRLFQRFN